MVIALVLISFFLVYNTYRQESKQVAALIYKEVDSIIVENENFLKYLSARLKRNGNFEDSYILSLIKDTHNLSYKSLTSSYISWADKDGLIKVSGKGGIIEKSFLRIDHRSYFNSALKEPEKIKISPIEKSIFSHKLVLPTALAVEYKGEVKGFFVLGLAYNELLTFIKESIRNEKFDFLVLVDNLIFVKSNNLEKDDHLEKFLSQSFAKPDQKKIEVVLYLKPKELLALIIHETVIFLPLYIFLVLLSIQLSAYQTIILEMRRMLNKGHPQQEKDAPLKMNLDSLRADIRDFEKEKYDEMKLLDMLSSNIKYAMLSVEEKEKYYNNYQQNISSNFKIIVDKIQTLNLLSDKEKEIKDSVIHDIENVINNDWFEAKEFSFNIGYIIEECLSFHLKTLNEIGIMVRKNYKARELFFTGKYDVVKGLFLATFSYAASRILTNGEIRIFAEIIQTEDTKGIKIIIKHTRSVKPDNIFRSSEDLLSNITERAKKVKNLKFRYQFSEDYLTGTFTFMFIEPLTKNRRYDINNLAYKV